MKALTSRHNPLCKRIVRLQRQPQHYRDEQVALLDGVHLLAEWAAHGSSRYALTALLLDEAAMQHAEVSALLPSIDPNVIYVCSPEVAGELAQGHSSMHVQALIDVAAARAEPLQADAPALLIDRVQDAGNVGSLMRTAAAAGVQQVVLSAGCAAAFSPKVMRAAMGAHFHLRVQEQAELGQVIEALTLPVYAADVSGTHSLYEAAVPLPCAWLVGSEGDGVAPQLLARCAQRLRIPQRGPQSMNVGAAAAVCLFESVRQAAQRG